MKCTTEIKISVLVFWHDHCENSRTFVKEHILSRFEITGVVYEQKHILTLYVKVPGSVLCCLYFLSSILIFVNSNFRCNSCSEISSIFSPPIEFILKCVWVFHLKFWRGSFDVGLNMGKQKFGHL